MIEWLSLFACTNFSTSWIIRNISTSGNRLKFCVKSSKNRWPVDSMAGANELHGATRKPQHATCVQIRKLKSLSILRIVHVENWVLWLFYGLLRKNTVAFIFTRKEDFTSSIYISPWKSLKCTIVISKGFQNDVLMEKRCAHSVASKLNHTCTFIKGLIGFLDLSYIAPALQAQH